MNPRTGRAVSPHRLMVELNRRAEVNDFGDSGRVGIDGGEHDVGCLQITVDVGQLCHERQRTMIQRRVRYCAYVRYH